MENPDDMKKLFDAQVSTDFADLARRAYDQNYGVPDIVQTMKDAESRNSRAADQRAGRFDAEQTCGYLLRKAREFQKSLNESEELGLQLANFGIAQSIHVRGIGFRNPHFIEFTGVDSANCEVTLVQHLSQLSFLFIALKPIAEVAYRVGFGQERQAEQ